MPSAAVMPARPPPIISADAVTGSWPVASGFKWRARATAMDIRSTALSVAATGSSLWTQEHWSRMLVIANRYWFSPLSRSVSWKRIS